MAKILVVENCPFQRFALVKFLSCAGYQVFQAPTCEAAVQLFFENPDIDLIITDYLLDDETGLHLRQQLMDELGTLSVPVVMLSAAKDHQIEKHFSKTGGTWIAKPVNPSYLAKVVQDMIERYQVSDWTRHMDHGPASRAAAA